MSKKRIPWTYDMLAAHCIHQLKKGETHSVLPKNSFTKKELEKARIGSWFETDGVAFYHDTAIVSLIENGLVNLMVGPMPKKKVVAKKMIVAVPKKAVKTKSSSASSGDSFADAMGPSSVFTKKSKRKSK